MAVPGHTLGHIAYYGHGALFCGDTLFSGGWANVRKHGGADAWFTGSHRRAAGRNAHLLRPRYTLGNLRFAAGIDAGNADLIDALDATRALRERDAITLPSELGRERRINPFLRCRLPAVRSAAEAQSREQPLAQPSEVFAAVRSSGREQGSDDAPAGHAARDARLARRGACRLRHHEIERRLLEPSAIRPAPDRKGLPCQAGGRSRVDSAPKNSRSQFTDLFDRIHAGFAVRTSTTTASIASLNYRSKPEFLDRTFKRGSRYPTSS